jgi:hypothetical protein
MTDTVQTTRPDAPRVNIDNRPPWTKYTDEFPHPPADMPLWNETYLDYGFSPESGLGFWVHLRHVPDPRYTSGIWDIVMFIALPRDEFLVARIDSPGDWNCDEDGLGELRIAGLSWQCEGAFWKWTKRLRGTARHVTEAELRAGPLQAGSHVPFALDYTLEALTPPWDHETGKTRTGPTVDTAYSKFHYAQHHRFEATLEFDGQVRAFSGKGLRDHSWGPRDWRKMGHTTWMQARRDDGYCFSVTYTPETAYKPGLNDPKVGNAEDIHFTRADNIPVATNVTQAHQPFEFTLYMPDGSPTAVSGETAISIPMHLCGAVRQVRLGRPAMLWIL